MIKRKYVFFWDSNHFKIYFLKNKIRPRFPFQIKFPYPPAQLPFAHIQFLLVIKKWATVKHIKE